MEKLSDMFCHKAKKSGTVKEITDDYLLVEYNDGTITVSWGKDADYKEIDIYTGYDDYDEDEGYYNEEENYDEEERYDEDDDYGEDEEEEEDW